MKNYTDNDCKFVAILNKKIELPRLLNALAHIAAGLTSIITEPAQPFFLQYLDKDGSKHPAISKFPFIILSADNSNQIRTARNSAIAMGLPYNDFTDTMLGLSADDQLNNTKVKTELELEYFALAAFGPADEINVLTKKFSLFRTPSPVVNALAKQLMFH